MSWPHGAPRPRARRSSTRRQPLSPRLPRPRTRRHPRAPCRQRWSACRPAAHWRCPRRHHARAIPRRAVDQRRPRRPHRSRPWCPPPHRPRPWTRRQPPAPRRQRWSAYRPAAHWRRPRRHRARTLRRRAVEQRRPRSPPSEPTAAARPHPAHVRGHAVTGEYRAADGRELAAQRDTGAGRDGIAPERYDGGRWSSDAPVGGGYGAPPVEPSRAGTESGMRESARVRQGMVQGRGPGVPRWREARSRRVPRWVRQGAPGAAAAWLEAPRRGIVAPHAARFASAT